MSKMRTIRFKEAGHAFACVMYLEAEGFPSVWIPKSSGRHEVVTMASLPAIRNAAYFMGFQP